MTKRDAQAAEYAEEQVQVAAARQMESQIVGMWQASQRARAKSSDVVDRLVEVSGWALMSTPAREAVLEAAGEIGRLRAEKAADWKAACESARLASAESARLRLTDAEREAVEVALVWVNPERQDTLRGLLERLK